MLSLRRGIPLLVQTSVPAPGGDSPAVLPMPAPAPAPGPLTQESPRGQRRCPVHAPWAAGRSFLLHYIPEVFPHPESRIELLTALLKAL